MKRRTLPFLLLCVAWPFSVCSADQITLAPLKDNTIFEDAGDLSNGQGSHLFAGATANRNANLIRRALLSFDILNNLPAGAIVTSASVELTVNKVPGGSVTNDFALHRVLQDWGEGSSNAPGAEGRGTTASPEDATWDVAMEGVDWVNPGGDFVDTPSASTSVAGTGRYTWDSTDMLVADVQRWLTSPEENFGWILIGDESRGRTAKRFHSLQNSNESGRPALNIEFEIGSILAGDYDEDGSLTPTDIGLLCGAINGGLNPVEFDVDGSGVVDSEDLTVWVQDLAGTNLGDTNLDGSVAFGDFLVVSAAFGQAGTWENGDFDCSGQIAFPDFLVLSANFGKTGAAVASVPEPGAFTLLLPTILFVRRRRLSSMEKR